MSFASDHMIREAVLENKKVIENLEHLIQDIIEHPGEAHALELAMFMKCLNAAVDVERNREVDDYDTSCYGLE